MANVSLAAQLAKQAAQAAMAEAGGDVPQPKNEPQTGWRVPVLPDRFSLDDALGRAMDMAKGYMNHLMATEGLVVDLQQQVGGNASDMVASVRELGTDKVYRAYTGDGLLRLYAAQRQEKGVVVDGSI